MFYYHVFLFYLLRTKEYLCLFKFVLDKGNNKWISVYVRNIWKDFSFCFFIREFHEIRNLFENLLFKMGVEENQTNLIYLPKLKIS